MKQFILLLLVFATPFIKGEVNMLLNRVNTSTVNVSCVVTGEDLLSGVLLNYKLDGDVKYVQQDWNRKNELRCVNIIDCFEDIDTNEWEIGGIGYEISDLRFEDLNTITTSDTFMLADIKVEKLRQYFSVLAKHITVAVCEKNEYSEDNKCYLFVFDEDSLTLLDCQLPSAEATTNGCISLASTKVKTVSDKEWWSFYIYYAGGEIRVNNARDNTRLIGFKKNRNAKYVFIKSKNTALWKTYINDYIHTHEPEQILKVKSFDFDSTYLCIGMEISLGTDCYFEITAERDGVILKETIQLEDKERKYRRVEFNYPETAKGPVTVSIQTNGDGDFWWALYSLHSCPTEPRVITSVIELPANNKKTVGKELFCQGLKSKTQVVKETAPDGVSQCEVGHFGQSCDITCSGILGPNYNNCQRVQICSQAGCKCAQGFWGDNCLQGVFISTISNLLTISEVGSSYILLDAKQNKNHKDLMLSDNFIIEILETFEHKNTKIQQKAAWPPKYKSYKLTDLKPGVTYSIRAIFFDTDDVPFFNVTTNCEGEGCGVSTAIQSTSGCILPEHPKNGNHQFWSGTRGHAGTYISSGTVIKYVCNEGYRLEGFETSVCNNNSEWTTSIPKCLASCKPLVTDSLELTCSYNGNPRRCEDEMIHATVVTYRCKQFYETQQTTNSPAIKCVNGRWSDPIPSCNIICGRKNPKGVPLLISSNEDDSAEKYEYPWHVGIYKISDNTTYVCGGSIINFKLVITAAHCFDTPVSPEKYVVSAGRYFSKYVHSENEFVQNNKVENINFTLYYAGINNHYVHDIAVVSVKKPFEFNIYVSPVCIDWNQFLPPMETYELGHVVGWGYTKEDGPISEKLNHIEVPFIPYGDCINKVSSDFATFVTPDKFCAGYTNGTSVCHGDSGGGFTRELVLPYGQTRHYLAGVVSRPPRKGHYCDAYQFAAYTDIRQHIDFIRDIEISIRTNWDF